MFFWNSLAFSMIQRMLAIWSLVPLPFLKPAGTSGSSWFTWGVYIYMYWHGNVSITYCLLKKANCRVYDTIYPLFIYIKKSHYIHIVCIYLLHMQYVKYIEIYIICHINIYMQVGIYWRRKWQPTPLFLPGKSQGWRSLVGYKSWGLTVDVTEQLNMHALVAVIPRRG